MVVWFPYIFCKVCTVYRHVGAVQIIIIVVIM